MKRRILLVDDEVAVLLTLKAVLEISNFDVDTATSAREGKARIRHREYDMVITDMRMEDEHAGKEVIAEARAAAYKPAIALLTAFPVDEISWQDMGADKMLVKPMHTRVLLQQLEALFIAREHARESDLAAASQTKAAPKTATPAKSAAKRSATLKKTPVKKIALKTIVVKKALAKTVVARKAVANKPTAKKTPVKKTAAKKTAAKKTAAKKTATKKTGAVKR